MSELNRETALAFLCPACLGTMHLAAGRIHCMKCGARHGAMQDDLLTFDDCLDKHSFFEKQAVERLDRYYVGYDRSAFLDDLTKTVLWQMDERNKRVGITRKFWWEDHVGKIENKQILEIGCGVNYIVPYFVESQNQIVAFDICRESVEYSKKLVSRIFGDADRVTYAVADAQRAEFPPVFDVVDISNVLHHIEDKDAVFERAHRALKRGGKMIIVEPNYYYPPRWIIETEAFDPYNWVKNYFVRNSLIEKGEHAIIFSDMVRQIENAGFRIDVRRKDDNYLGYFTVYWLKERTALAKAVYQLDKYVFSKILPQLIAPFEYLVATKA